MKVLFIHSGNKSVGNSSFTKEQADSLIQLGIEVDFLLIHGKGLKGYLRNLPKLKRKIRKGKFDLVHAHYGLSGVLAVLQRICPTVVTFQGSDIYTRKYRILSRIAIRLSALNIFVSKRLAQTAGVRKKNEIIPYGVNMKDVFFPMDKEECRRKMNLGKNDRIALFSSSFKRKVKNYSLARESVQLVENLKLVELQKEYTRKEIAILLNACDFLLMTSFREGCPVIVLEAMACNCPVISTDVGNVRELISTTEGCFVTSFDPQDIEEKIRAILEKGQRTAGRKNIVSFDNDSIASKVLKSYEMVMNRQ